MPAKSQSNDGVISAVTVSNPVVKLKPDTQAILYVDRLQAFIDASPEGFFYPTDAQWGGINEYIEDIIADAKQLTALTIAARTLGYKPVFSVPFAYHPGTAVGVERGSHLYFERIQPTA